MFVRSALILVLLSASAVSFAQQLPAGTREADDHSREDAANARIQAAEEALEKNDFTTAVTLLTTLAKEHPGDAHILYDLGYAQENTGKDDAAAETYAKAIEAAPALAEPRVALGLLDARANRSEKARRELVEVVSLPSASPQMRGQALRALASLDEATHPDAARDELLQAVKLTGETPSDIQLSAALASHAGDATDAESAYRRTLAADPENAEAAAGLASILQRSGKVSEAEALLQSALKAHPGDPRLISHLAAVYGAEDKAQQGIDLLTEARAADPALASNEAATRMLARLDAMGDKNEDAGHLYESLIARKPDDPELLDEYGGVLVKLNKYPEAESVLAKAVNMRSGFEKPEDWAEAAGHLAFAASKNHEPKVTLQALAARATVLPNSPASLFLEATAHDSLRETKDAIKAYRAFLTVANGNLPDEEFQARHRLVALEHMH